MLYVSGSPIQPTQLWLFVMLARRCASVVSGWIDPM